MGRAYLGISQRGEEQLFVSSENSFFFTSSVRRYGYGHFRQEFGSGVWNFTSKSSGGFPLYILPDPSGFLQPIISVDINNIMFSYSLSSDDFLDHYNYMPAVGAGVEFDNGKERIVVVGRTGVSINNISDRRFLHPDTYGLKGWQATVTLRSNIGASYDESYFGNDSLRSFTLFYKPYGDLKFSYRRDIMNYDEDADVFMFSIPF